MSIEDAALELGISEATVALYIEDGIATSGGDRVRLRVTKSDANDPGSYQISWLDLKKFQQQRKQVLKAGKDIQTRNTNDIKRPVFILALLVSILMLLFVLGYVWRWDWTGVTPTKEHSWKTLWDWLSLLIPPFILSAAGYFIGIKIYSERKDKIDREIAANNRHEKILQDYLDKISEYLQYFLKNTKVINSNFIREIAQARTHRVLNALDDPIRRGEVIRFLHSVGLIKIDGEKTKATISLDGANLERIALRWAKLPNADLRYAHMREADLREAELPNAILCRSDLCLAKLYWVKLPKADLKKAKLSRANLREAVLTSARLDEALLCGADLRRADLQETNLSNADLYGANLSEANLSNADLYGANLSEANLSEANLSGIRNIEKVLSLKGTNLRGVKGLDKELLKACEAKGAKIREDPTTTSLGQRNFWRNFLPWNTMRHLVFRHKGLPD